MEKPQNAGNIDHKNSGTSQLTRRLPSRLQSGASSGVFGKEKIVFPFLLATLTGTLLGVCLLFLFKVQPSASIVSANSPAAESGEQELVSAEAELPGVSLFAMQIGVFKERARAEALQAAVADKGVGTVVRGEGPFQVFTAVTADKAAAQPLEAELKKLEIQHYAKEFLIPARSGRMIGVGEAGAKAVTEGLKQELQVATSAMQLSVLTSINAEQKSSIQEAFSKLEAERKNVLSILDKGKRSEEKAILENMHRSLAEAIDALKAETGMFAVQVKVTAFYLGYESLVSKLLKSV